ncbi:MAG: MerR family transcriptional regulator [Candidatus Methylomirabilales bacterium]
MNHECSAGEVAQLVGVPYRTLMYWVATGLVVPAGLSQSGGRRRVRFRSKEVREIQLLVELRRHLSGPQLRRALNYLRRMGHNPLSTGRFMVVQLYSGRKEFIKVVGDREAIRLLRQEPADQGPLIPYTEAELEAGLKTGKIRVLFSSG